MSKGKLSEMEKVTLRREKTHKNEAHTQREENREKFRSKDKMYENMRKAKVKNTRKYQVNSSLSCTLFSAYMCCAAGE